MFEKMQDLKVAGFFGFVRVADLMMMKCSQAPNQPGVYILFRTTEGSPMFTSTSTGGHFKDRNPAVSVEELQSSWVQNSRVVYIGKAGGGGTDSTLRSRLSQYMRFGQGNAVAHWGGRYIWQLADHRELLVCWKTADDPRGLESTLIDQFKSLYGALPFANLTS